MRGGWVYFITNRRDGILYVGVTSNLARRAHEHREGLVPGFSKRYGLTKLVYCEHFDDIRYAVQREKTIKQRPGAWKVRLIHAQNPSGRTYTTRLCDEARPQPSRAFNVTLGVACSSCPRLSRASTSKTKSQPRR
jgi:putative endonuclease